MFGMPPDNSEMKSDMILGIGTDRVYIEDGGQQDALLSQLIHNILTRRAERHRVCSMLFIS